MRLRWLLPFITVLLSPFGRLFVLGLQLKRISTAMSIYLDFRS
jgi:hypothetical protein